MAIRLGINPLTWTNDDLPALGAETPLATCLAEGKLAGFEGFELGNKFPRDPAVLRPILESHKLKLVSGWHSLRLLERSVEEEILVISGHIDLLAALGCPVVVVCEVTGAVHGCQDVPVRLRAPFPRARWDEFAQKLESLAAYTAGRGVRLAYHHHMGTVIQTEAEVDELMRRTSVQVSLLLDTGHMVYAGGDPLAVARRWRARIAHVHCKDIRAEVVRDALSRNLSFLDAVLNGVFTVPGDGCVDYPAIFKVLAGVGYDGWLVVEAEQDPAIAHPLTYARLGHANVVRFAREAGLID